MSALWKDTLLQGSDATPYAWLAAICTAVYLKNLSIVFLVAGAFDFFATG